MKKTFNLQLDKWFGRNHPMEIRFEARGASTKIKQFIGKNLNWMLNSTPSRIIYILHERSVENKSQKQQMSHLFELTEWRQTSTWVNFAESNVCSDFSSNLNSLACVCSAHSITDNLGRDERTRGSNITGFKGILEIIEFSRRIWQFTLMKYSKKYTKKLKMNYLLPVVVVVAAVVVGRNG